MNNDEINFYHDLCVMIYAFTFCILAGVVIAKLIELRPRK